MTHKKKSKRAKAEKRNIVYVSFGDIKGMSNIKDVEQQSCCCCCCYHGKKIYNFPFLFLCMPNGIRNCMYSSGGREKRAKKMYGTFTKR